jgi:hypothetical protein
MRVCLAQVSLALLMYLFTCFVHYHDTSREIHPPSHELRTQLHGHSVCRLTMTRAAKCAAHLGAVRSTCRFCMHHFGVSGGEVPSACRVWKALKDTAPKVEPEVIQVCRVRPL